MNVTSKLFKGLIRRNPGSNEYNPFSKGALSFDDYSYKYFNEVVLSEKAVKQINEEEEEDPYVPNRGDKSKPMTSTAEDDSILTAEHIKDFETPPDALDPALGDFLPKEVAVKLH